MRALHAMGQRASKKLTSTLESAGNQFRVHTGPVRVHCVLSLLRGVDWSEIGDSNAQSQHQWMQCQTPLATPSLIFDPSATRGHMSIPGAMDIIIVMAPDGSLRSTDWHVQVGRDAHVSMCILLVPLCILATFIHKCTALIVGQNLSNET